LGALELAFKINITISVLSHIPLKSFKVGYRGAAKSVSRNTAHVNVDDGAGVTI
jgi:hypothetical protein